MANFQPVEDDWNVYVKLLKIFVFFSANGLKNDSKVAVLITLMGLKAY